MKRRNIGFAAIVFVIAMAIAAFGVDWQTFNPAPSSNSSFLTDLQTFLNHEDAQRFNDTGVSFVKSGGVISTGAGLTKTPTALVAYPGGYRITESGAITFNASTTCYVIAHRDLTGNVSTFVRVSGTHYLIDCTSGAEPSIPTNSLRIATVVTNTNSVTTVTDRRFTLANNPASGGTGLSGPYTVGDLLYAPSANPLSFALLSDIATGNVLLTGGVGVAPAYGKVQINTSSSPSHVTGTLQCANGGVGTTTPPTSGQVLFGNGTCYSVGSILVGRNIRKTFSTNLTLDDTIVNDVTSTTTTVTNTTSETTMLTSSIAANTLNAGAMVDVNYRGWRTNASGGTVNYTIRLKFGASTVATITLASPNGESTLPYKLIVELQSSVTSAQQEGVITLLKDGASPIMARGLVSENAAIANNLVITIQPDTATSGASINRTASITRLWKSQ